MTICRRQFIGFTAAVAAATAVPLPAQAQIVDLGDAINKAGRQRMASQRSAKAYMALGQKIQTAAATKALEQAMSTFDRGLIELKTFAPTPEIKETYTQLEAQWSTYKGLLVGEVPSAANAPKLIAQDGVVLNLANQGTVQLEQFSGKPGGRLTNLSGRCRFQSQRMAKYYLAIAWGVDAAAATAEIEKSRAEFKKNLEILSAAPETTPEIKQELEMAAQQWVLYGSALSIKPTATTSSHVFSASENLLALMDKITTMYGKLGKA